MGVDLADMQLISKFTKKFRLYYVLLIFIANMRGLLLSKIKKGTIITSALQKILNEANRKPNKMWVNKDSEFYNRSKKSGLQKMI